MGKIRVRTGPVNLHRRFPVSPLEKGARSAPQNDFLSPDGVTWGMVGQNVTDNNTVENIESLLKAAKANDIPVFISPHYYFPTDHSWKFEGTLEKAMHQINMFDRPGPLDLEGFEGSGADWLERYKPYINDGETIVTSPHKVYGPETNDLVLQLRKRGIDKVILGGMSANLCTESHMRELLEQGFEVVVVKDATAAAITPELGDGYAAAMTTGNPFSSANFPSFRYFPKPLYTNRKATRTRMRRRPTSEKRVSPSSRSCNHSMGRLPYSQRGSKVTVSTSCTPLASVLWTGHRCAIWVSRAR